ncbi:beta-ketoacyl-[acyl-carrier-protein] synthase II [Rufibacter immobilis]|uniref:3-oxoacyl-[acyl-carrier-protein] synthase 2 n=1 Tax=Rufibacter immobilis TaxID=1348778 RepID=A0A3M9MYA3_9BACT|nr:beta-ketoacyl-ACP synthase II [Rufibacter immobilis]RNI30155.1 beta-ketoacyl-[acyl-carrier-protein] synthase II [Rufibacter immobilis]
MKRVVITGLGALTPIGNTVDAYWQALTQGVGGAGPITKFDASKFKTRFACELKDFNPQDFLAKPEVRKYDLYTQYALVAVEEAVQHAGLDFERLNRNRIGVIWGTGHGGMGTFQEQTVEFAHGDGTPRFNPYFIPKMIVDIAAGVISMKYGLRGINFAPVSACASSNTALIEAFNYIRWGKADMIIAGGSEAPINETCMGGFGALKALSTHNEDPTVACRPFDVKRDGFVMGEGAGALILESYESAQQRNATILAEVVGGGMAADAYHLTGTHPEGEGAYLGMTLALEEANLSPAEIDYLNCHATSTPVGDASELKAVERVFGQNPRLHLSATKSMTGHLLGAAGAIEAIACVKAVQHNLIPPTINVTEPEPQLSQKFNLTLHQAVATQVKYAMSNTFGFGGHIATAIFKKFEE